MLPSSLARACRSLLGTSGVCLVCAVVPCSAQGLTGTWTGDFSVPAFDGFVSTCAVYNGTFYVGGSFRWAAGVRADNVASWTGSAWAPVGGGLEGRVRRLTQWGSQLLAGTSFGSGSTVPVMQFDGVSWQPLGPELYGQTDALLAEGADVYAAGSFYQVGSTNGNRVMHWDGSAWQPVGGTFDATIHSLAFYQGDLYAGGEFLTADDTFVSRIARWDGTHWQPVGGGTNAGGGISVAALAVFQNRLIAGGYFAAMGPIAANGIAAWNGIGWEALPNVPVDFVVSDLQVEGNLLHASGVLQVPYQWAAGLVTFDGQVWNPPNPYPGWTLSDIAIGDGKLIAVGQPGGLYQGTPASISTPVRDVVVRDGTWHTLTAWKPTMRGLMGSYSTQVEALHLHQGELYAGGGFEYAADPPELQSVVGVARWGGDRWEPVGDGYLRGWVQELTSWRDRLIIGGPGLSHFGLYSSVLGWDGNEWSELGGRLEGWVSGLTVWQGALVAAGGVRLPGQTEWSGVAINHGAGWEILGSRLVFDQSSINDVVTFDDELYVAGSNLELPGIGSHALAHWNGSAWEAVPGTPGGTISCLLPRRDGLWVGLPSFSSLSGGTVWRRTGGTWTDMNSTGPVLDLIEDGDEVFAAGGYLYGHQPSSLAWWNGQDWHAIEGGPDLSVRTIAVLGNDLYAGGWFQHTADRQSEALARWSFQRQPLDSGIPHVDPPWPSPARDHVAFRFTLPRQGRVTVQLYDLSGKFVAKPVDEVLQSGTYERTWNLSGGRVPAGVYFAKIDLPGGSRSAKVVLTR